MHRLPNLLPTRAVPLSPSLWGMAFVLLVVLMTSGCATQPYEPRPLDPAASQAAWQAATPDDEATRRALAAQGIETTVWPLPAWDIDALTALALSRHADMAVARAELTQVQAAQDAALQRAGRAAEITAEHHSDHADRSPWSLGVVVDGFVTGAAQRAARGDEARALATEAGHLAAQTAWQVRQRVRNAHRELYFAQQAEGAAQELLTQRAALAASAQTRLARGAIDTREARLARQAEAEARQQAALARDASARARLTLASAVALPASAVARMNLRFEALAQSDPAAMPGSDLQGLALLNRLDVRAAVARYDAADAALRLELARQWPDLALRPGFLWDQGDKVWTLGLALTWPPGGRNQAAIAAAQARREVEAARFAVVQTAALASLETARHVADAALEQRDAARQRWADAQQAAQGAERRLASGDADRAEVLTASVLAAEAQAQWITAQAALWAAQGELEDAVQRPLDAAWAPSPAQREKAGDEGSLVWHDPHPNPLPYSEAEASLPRAGEGVHTVLSQRSVPAASTRP